MVKIKIGIKDIYENQVTLEVDSFDTIGNGKKSCSLNTDYINNNFYCQWVFNGIILNDDKTFDYYQIEDGDILIQQVFENPLSYKEKSNPNRFESNYSQIPKKVITLYIHYIFTGEERTLDIGIDKTVKQLKKEIEKLFNLNYSLDSENLIVKSLRGRNSRPILGENETLFFHRLKSGSYVYWGIQPVIGGKY